MWGQDIGSEMAINYHFKWQEILLFRLKMGFLA
jgi:hypothetical protein